MLGCEVSGAGRQFQNRSHFDWHGYTAAAS